MGSYVISVSLYTGCYRHIRISEDAPLFMLHGAVLKAFDFDDDHLHAFFLDDHYWSRNRAYCSDSAGYWSKRSKKYTLKNVGLRQGDKFKYLFDFGDEWRFQCRVLRRVDEETDIPCILRSIGESPKQYPDEDDFLEEDYGEDEDDDEDGGFDEDDEYEKEMELWRSTLPQTLPEEELIKLYSELPVPQETVNKLRRYCTAIARVYGIAPITLAYELYCKYEKPLKLEDYLACIEVFRHEELCFSVLGSESLYQFEEPSAPTEREIIYGFLLLEGPEMYYFIKEQRGTKPMFPIEREELLRYAEEISIPETLQAQAMLYFLNKDLKDKDMAVKVTSLVICMIAAECHMNNILKVLAEAGFVPEVKRLQEFFSLYKELNNHTRKFANYGFTPWELSAKGKREQNNKNEDQLSLF